MWFVYAMICFAAWGVADLFYKRGAVEKERYSHLKTTIIVGFVMGATAIITIFVNWIEFNPLNLFIYFPVSAMYILSMTVGYFGLRYLEVSISSPIQNASGAVSAILLMIVLRELPDIYTIVAIFVISLGVVLLGVFEHQKEVKYLQETDKKYKIGFIAFMMPIFYCIIDALGTFLDGVYLDDFEKTPLVGVTEDNLENIANISYQLTFLIVAIILAVYVYEIKHEKFELFSKKSGGIRGAQMSRLFAALFETGGQFAYVYAMSRNGIAAAPVVASYCVMSLILGVLFLKERLSFKQYIAIGLVIAGIITLGVLEGLSGAGEAAEEAAGEIAEIAALGSFPLC
ncbi:MAG: DMT family transporter [Clostridia bacterium]|nr:DMT family transporter [Clostridia bacterium]